MSKEQDRVFFRNFSLVVGALAVMMVIFIIAARMFGIDETVDAERRSATVAERTEPMGEVFVEGDTEAAAATGGEGSAGGQGKEVYDNLCASCHGAGIPGIPQMGDAEAWAPRIAKGNDTLYENAINGYTGESGMMMPARGGNAELSDEAVKAAVDYMVTKSTDGSEGSAAEAEEASSESIAEDTEAVAANGGEGSAGGRGKEVYDNLCASCHGSGIPNIPQLGKADEWAPRIAKGKDKLYENAINGFTGESGMMMPARGGSAELSDDEVKAAVDYMIANSQ